MNSYQKQYNELLSRYYKAEEYLDNQTIGLSEREKYIPLALEIIANMNQLLQKIGQYTDNEVLNGFALEVKQIDD